jgi:regulator of nucleoside diphosphate kinase
MDSAARRAKVIYVMENEMVLTSNDYERIMHTAEVGSLNSRNPEIAGRLLKELRVARRIPQDRIARTIVTMNSTVLLTELTSGRKTELTITYPSDADGMRQKISVFTPIGIALLGRREGDVASWRIPGGVGRFRVEKIVYQPEAAGDYDR